MIFVGFLWNIVGLVLEGDLMFVEVIVGVFVFFFFIILFVMF